MGKGKKIDEYGQGLTTTITPLSVPTPRQSRADAQDAAQAEPSKTRKLAYTGSGSYSVADGGTARRFLNGAVFEAEESLALRLLGTGRFDEVG